MSEYGEIPSESYEQASSYEEAAYDQPAEPAAAEYAPPPVHEAAPAYEPPTDPPAAEYEPPVAHEAPTYDEAPTSDPPSEMLGENAALSMPAGQGDDETAIYAAMAPDPPYADPITDAQQTVYDPSQAPTSEPQPSPLGVEGPVDYGPHVDRDSETPPPVLTGPVDEGLPPAGSDWLVPTGGCALGQLPQAVAQETVDPVADLAGAVQALQVGMQTAGIQEVAGAVVVPDAATTAVAPPAADPLAVLSARLEAASADARVAQAELTTGVTATVQHQAAADNLANAIAAVQAAGVPLPVSGGAPQAVATTGGALDASVFGAGLVGGSWSPNDPVDPFAAWYLSPSGAGPGYNPGSFGDQAKDGVEIVSRGDQTIRQIQALTKAEIKLNNTISDSI